MLRIKRTTHRGTKGYLIYGKREANAFPVRVFTTSRTSAERIRDKLSRNRDSRVELEDFAPHRTCIADGCEAGVPWNQGSDYCAECIMANRP